MSSPALPPLPQGYTLDQSSVPPLPQGYKLEGSNSATPPNPHAKSYDAPGFNRPAFEKAYQDLPTWEKFKMQVIPGKLDVFKAQFNNGQYAGNPVIDNALKPTAGEVAGGAVDIAHGDVSSGAHRIITGGAKMALPMAPGMLRAPLTAAAAIGTGYLAGKTAKGAAGMLGASEDQKQLVEDLANFAGGMAGGGAVQSASSPAARQIAGKAAGAIAETVDPDLVGMLSPRAAHWLKSLSKFADWAKTLPEDAVPADVKPHLDEISKPYGLKGDQITDAVTVTPRQVIGPERQLPAATPEAPAAAPAKPPTTAKVLKDAGVTQAMKDAGVAAPSASMRPVREGTTGNLAPRADVAFPPNLSGEDAALMQLTKQNINELRFIAQKRGLPVSPKDTHTDLIGKIHQSMTPDEVAAFQQASASSQVKPSKFAENNAMAQALNDAANMKQAEGGSPYEVAALRSAASTIVQHPQNISQVDLTSTKIRGVDKRIGKRINDFFAAQQQSAPVTNVEVPKVPQNDAEMLDLLQRSIPKKASR